jgi:hypothetical protein
MPSRDKLGNIRLSASVSFRTQGLSPATELLALVGGSSIIARVVSRDHKGLRLQWESSSHRILAVQQRGEGKAYGAVVRGGVPASRGCASSDGSKPRERSSPPGWHNCRLYLLRWRRARKELENLPLLASCGAQPRQLHLDELRTPRGASERRSWDERKRLQGTSQMRDEQEMRRRDYRALAKETFF